MVYDKIEKIRLKNNTNTINILRLSFKNNPEESRKVLIKINEWDDKISKLLKELTLLTRRDYNLILNDLEVLRAENNKFWMELMKIASLTQDEYNELKLKADKYSNQISKLSNKL
tara:strand:+ start:1075 stop:1419 length:345 start_codon:yes stop_codon:yes gene_type:complete